MSKKKRELGGSLDKPEGTTRVLTLMRDRWGWSFVELELPESAVVDGLQRKVPCGALQPAVAKLNSEFQAAAARGEL